MSAAEPEHRSPGRPPLALYPVTVDNWQTCIHLRLAPEQVDRLASNLYSLAEAYVEPQCVPRAIYAGKRMIGFVMYEYSDASGVYSIPRFMIDSDFQGQGYGARALRLVIDTLKAERPDAPIAISLTADNHAARNLYERLGFEDTGQHHQGEQILRYP